MSTWTEVMVTYVKTKATANEGSLMQRDGDGLLVSMRAGAQTTADAAYPEKEPADAGTVAMIEMQDDCLAVL